MAMQTQTQTQSQTANGSIPWSGFGTIALAAFAGFRLSQDYPITGAILGSIVGYGAANALNLIGKPAAKSTILEATEEEEDEF